MALSSSSTEMVPEKGPGTESRRNKLARLCKSPSPPLRTTMAFTRKPSPLPAFSTSNRSRIRPIRPTPYSTTSVGSGPAERSAHAQCCLAKDRAQNHGAISLHAYANPRHRPYAQQWLLLANHRHCLLSLLANAQEYGRYDQNHKALHQSALDGWNFLHRQVAA